MGLASHRSATEVSAVQQLPERWAAYDNRCLNRRIVGWLPWKQMLKTPPSCHFLTFPLFLLFFLFPRRLSHSLSFLIFFFSPPYSILSDRRSVLIILIHFVVFGAFLVSSLTCILIDLTSPPSSSPLPFSLSPHSCTHSENCSSYWHFARGRLAQPHLLSHREPFVSLCACVLSVLFSDAIYALLLRMIK